MLDQIVLDVTVVGRPIFHRRFSRRHVRLLIRFVSEDKLQNRPRTRRAASASVVSNDVGLFDPFVARGRHGVVLDGPRLLHVRRRGVPPAVDRREKTPTKNSPSDR